MVNLAPGETINVEYEAVNVGDVDSTQTLELTTQNGSTTVVDSVSQTFTVGQTGTGTLSWSVPSGSSEELGLQLCVGSENSTDCIDLNIVSIPSHLQNSIYIPENGGTITSVDPVDGSVNWDNSSFDKFDSGVAVDASSIYINDNNNFVYSISASDGTEEWSYDTQSYGAPLHSSPSIYGSNLYCQKGASIVSLDKDTGNLNWEMDYPSYTVFENTLIVTANAIYVTTQNGELLSVDRSDGSLNWNVSINGSDRSLASGILKDGFIYILTNNGTFNAVDISTQGTWSEELSTVPNNGGRGLSIDGNTAYAVIEGDGIYVIDIDSRLTLTNRTDFGSISSDTLVDNGNIYLQDEDTNLLYSIDLETLTDNWTYSADFSIRGSVAKRGDVIYTGGAQQFHAVDAQDGSEIWTIPITSYVNTNIIGGADSRNFSNRLGAVGNTVYLPDF